MSDGGREVRITALTRAASDVAEAMRPLDAIEGISVLGRSAAEWFVRHHPSDETGQRNSAQALMESIARHLVMLRRAGQGSRDG